MNSKKKASAD